MGNIAMTGRAVIRGVDGTIVFTGLAAVDHDEFIESVSLSHSANVDELQVDGETVNKAYTGQQISLNISYYPAAPASPVSPATAISAAIAAVVLPPAGSIVTLTNFRSFGTVINATYIYDQGGSIELSGGAVKVTLPISRPTSNTFFGTVDQAVTALTTAISYS